MGLDDYKQPVIILGFHHSGTRMLAEVLGQCGLFQVGLGLTYEWKYIQDLNDRIWESWWDLSGISTEELRRRAHRIDQQELLAGLELHGYKKGLWGFKDPRTCTTLATWLERFPQAKAVHIVRDPRDVLGTLPEAYSKFTPNDDIPQQALEFWSDLWVKNMEMVEEIGPKCAAFTSVRYEDLCAEPKEKLKGILSALGLENDLKARKAKLRGIKSKQNKFLRWLEEGKLTDKNIATIERSTADKMSHFGYA